MNRLFSMGLFFYLPLLLLAQAKVNQGSLTLQEFDHLVMDYAKLHKTVRSKIPAMKPTKEPAAIDQHERSLARGIREARATARQGLIFTPEIAAQFHALLNQTMHGPEAARIRESMKQATPVQLPAISVNAAYPSGAPLQTTPPSLLANLPKLPPELEYRVVGRSLILRDIEANLIVDYLSSAIP